LAKLENTFRNFLKEENENAKRKLLKTAKKFAKFNKQEFKNS